MDNILKVKVNNKIKKDIKKVEELIEAQLHSKNIENVLFTKM